MNVENVDENAVGGAHFCPNIVEFKGAQSRELSSIQEAIEVLDVISENRYHLFILIYRECQITFHRGFRLAKMKSKRIYAYEN